ncbi:MAG: response regulator [Propioniciclava sp.]
MTTTVLIVDDSEVMRRGIRTLLELDDSLQILGEAADGNEALHLATQLKPQVTLMDVRMPGRDGLSVVAEIAALGRVLMLTFSDEPHVVREALASGAIGYLVHGTFDADSLAATVHSAAAGMSTLSGPALQAVQEPARAATTDPAPTWGLSARQGEVMDRIASGMSNRQIARELFLTEKTVKNHINQIFAKLGVSNRGEAMARWLGQQGP